MFRAFCLAAIIWFVWVPNNSFGQQFTGIGMLATGTAARTRLGGEYFQVGDMMYVTVLHPANFGKMYVSAHMEYQDEHSNWKPVPTKNTPLGGAYESNRYPGVRDYVALTDVSVNTTRHICLFMPYNATALSDGDYKRRYVLRLWNGSNREVTNKALQDEAIKVSTPRGLTLFTVVRVRTCATMEGNEGELRPTPESQDTGSARFFDTSTGAWVCP